MTVLSGRMLMVTCVTFYYYPPPPFPSHSVRGLPTQIPASSLCVCRKQADIAYAEAKAICLRNIVFPPPPLGYERVGGDVRCVQGFSLASEGGCDCDAGSGDV